MDSKIFVIIFFIWYNIKIVNYRRMEGISYEM